MSDNFTVLSLGRSYQVDFTQDFREQLNATLKTGDTIIIDKNILGLYKDHIGSVLDAYPQIPVDATEEQKSYLQLAPIIDTLISNGFRKNHRLIGIGGGITQDVTGFIASVLYRGVEWEFFPTSLLAQCDSCIGSKTSINFGSYKNQLGTFFPPSHVSIDTAFLGTLPPEAVISGLGEMIHYYLVSSEDDFNFINENFARSLTDHDVMKELVKRSLSIKKVFIEKDEFDKRERQILNYGHSFGHAIETLTEYGVPHGIAVSYGMDIANYLSSELGYISNDLRERMRGLLSRCWNRTNIGHTDVAKFAEALSKDKKNVGDEVRVILTRGIGNMFKTTLPLDSVTLDLFDKWFDDQRRQDSMKDAIR